MGIVFLDDPGHCRVAGCNAKLRNRTYGTLCEDCYAWTCRRLGTVRAGKSRVIRDEPGVRFILKDAEQEKQP